MKMAPRMRPATDLSHTSFRVGEKTIVRTVSVCLQIAMVLFEESFRPGAFARRGVIVNHRRVLLVSYIGPDPSGSGSRQTAVENLDRSVIGLHDFRCQYQFFRPLIQRCQQISAARHPVAKRLPGQ
jgi:hypothetical protein